MKDTTDLIARIFLSLIFFWEAFDTIKYYQETKGTMSLYGLTWQQDLLLGGAIFFLIFGAVLVLIGYRSKLGAVLLLIYWVPVTLIVFSFWNDAPEVYRAHSVQFMKNLAVIGGLLLLVVNGTGKYSVRRLFATTRLPRRMR